MNMTPAPSNAGVIRRVFLSGGLRSDWQDKVKKIDGGVVYLDPREHGLRDPHLYTPWNLDAVSSSDLVFAYMDKQNPSGFGLALEVGYAKGIGKPVILVDEKSRVDPIFDRYFAIVREAADVQFDSLEMGLKCLRDVIDWGPELLTRDEGAGRGAG